MFKINNSWQIINIRNLIYWVRNQFRFLELFCEKCSTSF